MATTTPQDLVPAYDPSAGQWQWVTIATFVNLLQSSGWLVGTRRMIKDGVTPEGPDPRPTDDGTVSNDPENVGGEQRAQKRLFAADMRATGAVETLGNWRMNGTGQQVTAYVKAKGNTGDVRVNYKTHGAADKVLTLMLPDVDDGTGNPWQTEVTFPGSVNDFMDVDFAGIALPDQLSVKIRFSQETGQNGNVSIQSVEVL